MMWGHHDQDEIASVLQRTPRAVFMRARHLGIGGGYPQGFESLQACADRCGFDIKTMRRVLNAHRVPIHRAPSIRGSSLHAMVEPHRADEAVRAWCRMETMAQAGRRLGIDGWVVKRHLEAAAARGEIELPAHTHKKHWRVPRTMVDAVFASWEDGMHAAARIGVSWPTLRKWLTQAGVERPQGRQWRVQVAVVDRIRDAKLGANARAFRSPISDAVVRAIRARRSSGATYAAIAAEFGITMPAARFIALGKTHKHVPFEPEEGTVDAAHA